MTLFRQMSCHAPRQKQRSNMFAVARSISAFSLLAVGLSTSANAQQQDCRTYARAYADSYVNPDPADLAVIDNAMRGAVAGGAWQGPSGARRGAVVGGALSALNNLGSTPGGWRGLYNLAYRQCRNATSSVTHRPSTLGDPGYRPNLSPLERAVPPLPPQKRAPMQSNR